jgi:hypothetical protein
MSYLEERRAHIEAGRPLPDKKKYTLNKVSEKRKKKLAEQKENKGDSGLDKWFDYHMKNSKPVCDNCGMEAYWLLEPQEDKEKQERYNFIWRACQAHVLPKKNDIGGFPSVASNLSNHLVLFPHFGGLCNCHGEFDSSVERMAKMKVFPKAIEIINKIYPMIAANERKYLHEIIVQEINPEIYNK